MSGNKVLIVDDDRDLQRALSIRLKANGYSTVFAGDGITAISIARKEMPDVVILDLALPGVDGFGVIQRLRAIIDLSAIPIIVVTARALSTTENQALNAGVAAFFQKPVDNDTLLAAIRKALGESTTQIEQRQPVKQTVAASGKKVMVVDDDKDLLRALHVRLKANGYNMVFATDGVTAIRVARQEVPDAIILDIGLPGGDGFTVMERLKNLSTVCATPIIVLSARDPAATKDRVLGAGALAFLQKPVDSDVLLAAIRKALGEPDGHLEPLPR
jgi:DNA-binding response OmpR family regulator